MNLSSHFSTCQLAQSETPISDFNLATADHLLDQHQLNVDVVAVKFSSAVLLATPLETLGWKVLTALVSPGLLCFIGIQLKIA